MRGRGRKKRQKREKRGLQRGVKRAEYIPGAKRAPELRKPRKEEVDKAFPVWQNQ